MKGYGAHWAFGGPCKSLARIEFIFDTSLLIRVLSLEITILTLLFQSRENTNPERVALAINTFIRGRKITV